MLYECLVGEPPPPRSPSGLVRTRRHRRGTLRLGDAEVGIARAPGVAPLIERAMQMNPADRYQDARSFAHDLRGVREDIAKAELVP